MKGVSLLLVEDEKNLRVTLLERLMAEGFHAVAAKDVASALKLTHDSKTFDLAIIDVGLPDGNGFELAKTLKAQKKIKALLFLTAQAGPEDRVRGLELGADDYMPKPFHTKELFLRIRNLMGRTTLPETEATVQVGRKKINFESYEIFLDDKRIATLSQKECALLRLLYESRGRVVSRETILDSVWSADESDSTSGLKDLPTTRTVDNFILRLRKLLEENSDEPKLIRSVRGVGYCLEIQS